MSNENLLQAPAQGFGQDVTFTARPGQPPMLDGLARRGQSRGGVQGVPAAATQQRMQVIEAPPPNPTVALLGKVAGEYLGNRIQQERAASFVTGMQRAAAGEAIKDIAEGDPWYAHIFGDSDVVEGARAYTAQAKAADIAGSIEDSMHEVRKLGPEESTRYFTDLVSKSMTGDKVTDATLMQGFARVLPATMRRHAKEHYAWRQEQASEAESSALLSAADLVQKRAGSDVQTDDEAATQAIQLIASMRPAEGRDKESWIKARTSDLLNLAQAGKFHAVNAIRTAGMLNLLPAESRTKVESALDSAENRTLANKSFEYADDIAAIAGQAEVYSTDLSPAATTSKLQELNQRFRRETGIDRDIISLDKAGGIIKDAHVTLLREGDRRVRKAEEDSKDAAKKVDTAQAKQLRESGADQLIAIGQAGLGAESDELRSVVHDRFKLRFDSLEGTPDAQAQLLALNYNAAGNGANLYVNKDIRSRIARRVEAMVGTETMPVELPRLNALYTALRSRHPALADAYFGEHAGRMAAYNEALVGPEGAPLGSRGEVAAAAAAFSLDSPSRARSLDKKTMDSGWQHIQRQFDNPVIQFWKQQGVKPRDDQKDAVMHSLGQAAERFMTEPGTQPDKAWERAWAARQRDYGDDMLAGFYIPGSRGQATLLNILSTRGPNDSAAGTGTDARTVWDEGLAETLSARAAEIGASMKDPVNVYRLPDNNGTAWLQVNYTASDGRRVPVVVSSNEIKQRVAEKHKAKQKPLEDARRISNDPYAVPGPAFQ